MAGRRVTGLVALVVAATTLTALPSTGPAQAAVPGAVTLPAVTDPALPVTVRLTSATATRLLATVGTWNGTRVHSGTPSLAPVAVTPALQTMPPALSGDSAVWADVVAGLQRVHRTDLVTGTDTVENAGTDKLLAASGSGWLGVKAPEVALHSGGVRRVLLSDVGSTVVARADATALLASYVPVGRLTSRLVLVDLASGAVTQLAAGAGAVGTPDLTPSSVVWRSATGLNRYDRATGTTTTRPLGSTPVGSFFAATDAATAYADAAGLRVAPADPAAAEVAVASSASLSSLVARGDGFAVTRDGRPGPTTGVFSVSAAGVMARLTDSPSAPERYEMLGLDAGRVVYGGSTTAAATVDGGVLARLRTVAGSTSLSVGAESTGAEAPVVGRPVSGTRTARSVLVAGAQIQFLDGGLPTGAAAGATAAAVKVSGPFAVADGRLLRRTSGAAVALPAADGAPVAADVYGSRFVYLTAAGVLRLLDAARPLSATNPRTLATGAAGRVGIAADTVAYGLDSGSATVVDLRTGTARALAGAVAVGDGVALVGPGTALSAVDLTAATLTPVPLGRTGTARVVATDDHRAAWVTSEGTITVAPLPFGAAHRPRVLGVMARAAFSPNGDGSADTWAPQVDVSKPLGPVTVTITSAAGVVRTLHGTAPLGSVRDVVWDGLTDAGAAAPDGTYTWTLTGDAADGDGPVAAVDGTSAVTGTVVVDRVRETAAVSVPASTALVRATDGLPVTWRRTSAASTSAAVFDVQRRLVAWDVNRRALVYYPEPALRTGTTATGVTIPGSQVNPGAQMQFSVRMRDVAGNTGPWSSWVAGSRSLDDRNLSRGYGSWSRVSSTGSFLGTATTSTSNVAVLNGAVIGSRLYVWATTCPTCGKLEVVASDSFGNAPSFVVDTRSATTRTRVLVLNQVLPRRYWALDIRPLGTTGRPRIFVDAVGSAL